MIGINAIRAKREIQWDRSQIMVPIGYNLKNTALLKFPND
jgi:hypothetical protein